MNIPNRCPACNGRLVVAELCCNECKTSIKGGFELPELASLSEEEEGFLKVSVKSCEFFWSCINFFFCIYSGVAKRNWSESRDSIRAPSHSWRAFWAQPGVEVSCLEFL